jgi:hypothetical protein
MHLADFGQVLNIIGRRCQHPLGHSFKEWVYVKLGLKDALLTTVVVGTHFPSILLSDILLEFSAKLELVAA